MIKLFSVVLIGLMSLLSQAQSVLEFTREHQVLSVVKDFGRAVQNKDSLLLYQNALPELTVTLARLKENNRFVVCNQSDSLFMFSWHRKNYQYVPQLDVRAPFAMVYGYFIAEDNSGMTKCGMDHYQLIKINGVWKVFEFSETVYDQCKNSDEKDRELQEINETLDTWHGLAAVGDTTYFDTFAEGSFYLGTDPKEVWTIQEFKDFALPYFRRGSAWSFKNKSRNVRLGDYGHYAWFDEKLDTWMGLCRGTGVMEKQVDGWRIKHYSLTVLVPNSKIKDYVKMINPE